MRVDQTHPRARDITIYVDREPLPRRVYAVEADDEEGWVRILDLSKPIPHEAESIPITTVRGKVHIFIVDKVPPPGKDDRDDGY